MNNQKLIVENEIELFNFLQLQLKYSNNKIKSILKHGNVLIDQKVITNPNQILKPKQIVQILKGNNQLPFKILYEDDKIIVIDKPSGILTIATTKEKQKTVYHYVSNYLKSKNKNQKVFIVHRLDKDTSGVLLLAKSQKVKNFYQQNWNNVVLKRQYVARVEGHLKVKKGCIIQYLKENKQGFVFITNANLGKKAITNYKVISEDKKTSLVDVLIETGRKNQIRLAFQSIGNPIVGDSKYGHGGRMCLHAVALKFKLLNKQVVTIQAPYPSWYYI